MCELCSCYVPLICQLFASAAGVGYVAGLDYVPRSVVGVLCLTSCASYLSVMCQRHVPVMCYVPIMFHFCVSYVPVVCWCDK